MTTVTWTSCKHGRANTPLWFTSDSRDTKWLRDSIPETRRSEYRISGHAGKSCDTCKAGPTVLCRYAPVPSVGHRNHHIFWRLSPDLCAKYLWLNQELHYSQHEGCMHSWKLPCRMVHRHLSLSSSLQAAVAENRVKFRLCLPCCISMTAYIVVTNRTIPPHPTAGPRNANACCWDTNTHNGKHTSI